MEPSGSARTLPDTPSLIGSIAKQFVAMPVMMLAERGALSYDDPLTKYHPGAPPSITLRHLLNHTSGTRGAVVGAVAALPRESANEPELSARLPKPEHCG